MSITLATTWNPRGETLRFRKLYPALSKLYDHMIVVMPPNTHAGLILSFRLYDKLNLHVVDNWSAGRYEALRFAVETGSDSIHYVDMDRLIRWAETRPIELHTTVRQIKSADFLVIQRTEPAYQTHPKALIETEALSNQIFSHILNTKLDLSAGSKGFRREVAEFILANSIPGRVFGTDVEWVVLARRAGFDIESVYVDGLDWESADRYQKQAADYEEQRRAAEEYDKDAENWKYRTAVAREIIEVGIETLKREISMPQQERT